MSPRPPRCAKVEIELFNSAARPWPRPWRSTKTSQRSNSARILPTTQGSVKKDTRHGGLGGEVLPEVVWLKGASSTCGQNLKRKHVNMSRGLCFCGLGEFSLRRTKAANFFSDREQELDFARIRYTIIEHDIFESHLFTTGNWG